MKEKKKEKDSLHGKVKDEDKHDKQEEEIPREVIKGLLPDDIIVIKNHKEESLRSKMQKNPEYVEKQLELETRFADILFGYIFWTDKIEEKKILLVECELLWIPSLAFLFQFDFDFHWSK